MKLFRRFALVVAISLVVIPTAVLADGLIVPPYDYNMYETGQEAVIFYENGVETLVISIGFEGDAEDFGWLVPVPSQPEVAKSSEELFTSLEELTSDYYYDLNDSAGRLEKTEVDYQGVSVIETQKIDYYEVTTLQAGSATALSDWLTQNDYNYPSAADRLLESYTENDWYFVAMKIATDELTDMVSEDLKSGHATPVEIAFETDQIVYPMKLTGAMSYYDPSEKSVKSAPKYITGHSGYAASLSKSDIVSLPLTNNFNAQKGTVAFWVKDVELDSYAEPSNYFSVVGADGQEALSINSWGPTLQFKTVAVDSTTVRWDANIEESGSDGWHHIAVTWSEGSAPQFYFDGGVLTTTDQSSLNEAQATGAISPLSDGIIYIGQDGLNLTLSSLNGSIDELAVFQEPLTAAQIAESYSQGSYALYDSLLWSASFEKNLQYTRLGGETGLFTYISQTTKADYEHSISIPTSMYLVLYVITDNKYTLPGFDTSYAGWLTADEVRDLAFDEKLQSWIDVTKNKYFLTKLTRYMSVSEMDSDLVLRKADNNEPVNAPDNSEANRLGFYLVLATGLFLSAALLVMIVYLMNKKDRKKPSNKSRNNKKKNNGQ